MSGELRNFGPFAETQLARQGVWSLDALLIVGQAENPHVV
jgi:hypothetical protein